MTALLWLPPRRHLAAVAQELPALRHWVGFGTRLPDAPAGLDALLESVFPGLPRPLPLAALTRCVDAPQDCAGRWLRADPCHLRVEVSGVRMLACGAMQLTASEVASLTDSVRPLFDDRVWRFDTAHPERWYVQPDANQAPLGGDAPEQVLGAYIDSALPVGDAGRATRIWLNELQMALHDHPVNLQRVANGVLPVNSLWLHGDGERPKALVATVDRTVSSDPLLRALSDLCGTDGLHSTKVTLIDAREPSPAVIAQVEQAFNAREPVTLCLESGERFQYRPWHRFRFWRKPQA